MAARFSYNDDDLFRGCECPDCRRDYKQINDFGDVETQIVEGVRITTAVLRPDFLSLTAHDISRMPREEYVRLREEHLMAQEREAARKEEAFRALKAAKIRDKRRAEYTETRRRSQVSRKQADAEAMAENHRRLLAIEVEAREKRDEAFRAIMDDIRVASESQPEPGPPAPSIAGWRDALDKYLASGSDDDKTEMLRNVQPGKRDEDYDAWRDDTGGAQGDVPERVRGLAKCKRCGISAVRWLVRRSHGNKGRPQQAQSRDDAFNPFSRG